MNPAPRPLGRTYTHCAAGGFRSFRDRNTLPVWLQRAGYRTFFAGKYLNGYGDSPRTRRYVPPGWDQWRATVGGSTYDFTHPVVNVDGRRLERHHEYNTRLFAGQTVRFVNTQEHARKPWFAWVNYVAPHHGGPHVAADPARRFAGTGAAFETTVPDPRDRGRYRGVPLPDRPDLFDRHTADTPAWSPSHRRFDRRQRRELRYVFDRRIEAVHGVDRAIGRTIAALRRTGQWRRTVLVFTSDNGYVTGEHNVVGKLWHYNEIVRVPMLMVGPGIPHRRVHTAITNADIPVTVAALAHARPLRTVDGIDMLPLLRAPTRLRAIPLESWPVRNGSRPRLMAGLRYGEWTYARLRGGAEELYDRARDPFELHNLAHRVVPGSEVAQMLTRLRRDTRAYLTCRGAECSRPLP